MRRSSIILLSFAFLLVGCGTSSSSSSSTKVACDQQFWNGTINACLPKGWRVLSKEMLQTIGVPEETVAAFQYETPRAGQLDTVTVTQEPLAQDLQTTDYSNANILAVSALPDYKLVDKVTVYVDSKETAIHIFSARPAADQPVRRYYQLSAVKDKVGYTFTGSFPLSIQDSEAAQVQFILKNVSFTDPTAVKAK
jgi:uncharacterized DUF497 family protein